MKNIQETNKKTRKVSKTKNGFTLVEVLTTLAIIGTLTSIVLVALSSSTRKADIATAQIHIKDIHNGVLQLQSDTGEWPGHNPVGEVQEAPNNEITDLTTGEAGIISTDGAYTGWSGPYLTEVPTDPWGNTYWFDPDYDIQDGPGETWAAVIGSGGPNGSAVNVYDEDNVIKILYVEE